MSADDINSYKTVIKAKLSGEDYHDIVIDWTDTSQPYEQQVFSRLAEISGISVERTAEFMFMDGGDRYEFFHNERAEPKLEHTLLLSMQLEFNRENLLNLMNGNERFGLSLRLSCDDNKHFYMWYAFVPERFMDETECTLNFCHYLDNRAILNKLKAIVTNDALQSQMKDFLVQPRFPYFDDFFLIERWHHAYRRFNVMQYYYRTCYPFYQNVMFVCQNFDYVPAQLYLRTRG
ncbi:uncharacterized protein LOC107365688 [Tetranychus urticae]|uniref:Uncharacterized protein n=1 Tax=Tetranychus urticae TaxID=32264 RepID=T1KMF6_TETUR|nr:uncharacterized protein LOC107365688 [Tetranychus urticae]